MVKRTRREEALDWVASNDRWLTRLPKELDGLHGSDVQQDVALKQLSAILSEFIERVRRLEEELAEHQQMVPVEEHHIFTQDRDSLSREAFYQALFVRLGDVIDA